ncbi:MAG: hypothetical protein ACREDR_03010 [Blastocatellia bacterium]
MSTFQILIPVLAILCISAAPGNGVPLTSQHQGRPGVATAEISGRITVRGKAAVGLRIDLMSEPDGMNSRLLSKSEIDSAGRYHFSGLSPGFYRLRFVVPGCVATGNDWHTDGDYQRIYLSEGSNSKDIDMVPAASISGRIVDADGGAVANEALEAAALTGQGGYTWLTVWSHTDADGAYLFQDLPPGGYLLTIGKDITRSRKRSSVVELGDDQRVRSDHYYLQCFYPGVTDRSKAQPVVVGAGQQVSGVDFSIGQLLKSYAVTGRVIEASTGQPLPRCTIELGHTSAEGGYSSWRSVDPSVEGSNQDGFFKLTGLLPGRFLIAAHADGDTDLYPETKQFEITDHDISGLELSLERGVTLRGKVSIDAAPAKADEIASKLAGLALTATWRNDGSAPATRDYPVGTDGTFELRGLRPGPVELSISALCDSARYLKLLRAELEGRRPSVGTKVVNSQTDQFGSISVPIEAGDSGRGGIRLVLYYHNARIRCHVEVNGGMLSPNALYASIEWHTSDGKKTATSRDVESDGTVYLDGLDPGDYDLFLYRLGGSRVTETKTVHLDRNEEARVSFSVKIP